MLIPFIYALCSALLASASAKAPADSLATKQPNIVVIITDDMGYSDIGCYGGEIRTPHIDALAANGLRFTNYYVNNMCSVTRASLMTGNYPQTARPSGTLNLRCVTVAELLKTAGYATLMAGKWHLGKSVRTGNGSPMGRGFDHWYGIPGGAASFFDPELLTRDGEDVSHEARENPDYYFTDALTDEAVRMIGESLDEDPDRPFFLYQAYTAAHWPLHARDSDVAKYKGQFSAGWDKLREKRHKRMIEMGLIGEDYKLSPRHANVPAWEEEEHKAWQERRMEVYAAQVTVMDEGVGRIVDFLKKRGVLENTLILYQHDNGACHVEYGKSRKGSYLPEKTRAGEPMIPGNLPDIMPGPENTYQSVGHGWANLGNTPFRLFKQHDHEGGDRSPLIAHWPAGLKTESGSFDRTVCHVTDLMPTLLDVTGIEYPKEFDGNSILPHVGRSFSAALKGEAVEDRKTIFWKNARGRAIRVDEWKLVTEGGNKGPWELYDLASDPTELHDLASTKAEKAKAMKVRWTNWEKRQQKAKAK